MPGPANNLLLSLEKLHQEIEYDAKTETPAAVELTQSWTDLYADVISQFGITQDGGTAVSNDGLAFLLACDLERYLARYFLAAQQVMHTDDEKSACAQLQHTHLETAILLMTNLTQLNSPSSSPLLIIFSRFLLLQIKITECEYYTSNGLANTDDMQAAVQQAKNTLEQLQELLSYSRQSLLTSPSILQQAKKFTVAQVAQMTTFGLEKFRTRLHSLDQAMAPPVLRRALSA